MYSEQKDPCCAPGLVVLRKSAWSNVSLLPPGVTPGTQQNVRTCLSTNAVEKKQIWTSSCTYPSTFEWWDANQFQSCRRRGSWESERQSLSFSSGKASNKNHTTFTLLCGPIRKVGTDRTRSRTRLLLSIYCLGQLASRHGILMVLRLLLLTWVRVGLRPSAVAVALQRALPVLDSTRCVVLGRCLRMEPLASASPALLLLRKAAPVKGWLC